MPVPSRAETLDDLYTTTWNNRLKNSVDQIFDNSPVFALLKKRGSIRFNGTGGRYLEIPLSYAKNETCISLGKGDTISLSETQFLTVAQFEWKYAGCTIVRYWVDDARNKSVQQHMSWINKKIDNANNSMTDYFEQKLFGDGTGNSNKDIEGLGNLVDTTPTVARTVGNIAQTTFTYWQNRQKTATGAASVYLLSDMRNLANTTSEGITRDFPDMIVTTQTVSELFDDEVLEQRQIINVKEGADPESLSTAWKGIPLVWSAQCTSGRMYFLNSQYLTLEIDPEYNFQMTQWKSIPNQVEDKVCHIIWKGNTVASRRKSLGVMTAIA